MENNYHALPYNNHSYIPAIPPQINNQFNYNYTHPNFTYFNNLNLIQQPINMTDCSYSYPSSYNFGTSLDSVQKMALKRELDHRFLMMTSKLQFPKTSTYLTSSEYVYSQNPISFGQSQSKILTNTPIALQGAEPCHLNKSGKLALPRRAVKLRTQQNNGHCERDNVSCDKIDDMVPNDLSFAKDFVNIPERSPTLKGNDTFVCPTSSLHNNAVLQPPHCSTITMKHCSNNYTTSMDSPPTPPPTTLGSKGGNKGWSLHIHAAWIIYQHQEHLKNQPDSNVTDPGIFAHLRRLIKQPYSCPKLLCTTPLLSHTTVTSSFGFRKI